jgi:stage V sporulation protein S
MKTLKISTHLIPNQLAGAIVALTKEEGEVEIQTAGIEAFNRAIKAIAIAKKSVESKGIDLITVPAFTMNNTNEETVKFTTIKLIAQKR